MYARKLVKSFMLPLNSSEFISPSSSTTKKPHCSFVTISPDNGSCFCPPLDAIWGTCLQIDFCNP